jgi:hypothetical protein
MQIAVLDTGVNPAPNPKESVSRTFRIGKGKSGLSVSTLQICTNCSGRGHDGHSTAIAALLLNTAPQEEIYVAQVSESSTVPMNPLLSSQKIAGVHL